jgi:plasmid rolling circle replication initiator protein Rep
MSNITNFSDLPKFFLADFSKDDQIWDKQRSNSQGVGEIYKNSTFDVYQYAYFTFFKYSQRIEKCSNILKFGFTEDNKIKLKQTFFCRVRYCPVCQWRKSMMWRARFFQIMPELSQNFPTHRWIFLTLTVKNCPIDELRLNLKNMSVAWNKFIKYADLSAIDGFVRTTEVTRGKDGSAHPHYHCLLLVKPSFFGNKYVKNDQFRELWRRSLNVDYLPVTHVKAVKGDTPVKAVLETLKYSTKPDDFFNDHNWFLKLTQQTHKTRFVATGGILKNCLKSEDDITNEDMINTEGDSDESTDDRRIAFFYNDDLRRYHRANMYDENFTE